MNVIIRRRELSYSRLILWTLLLWAPFIICVDTTNDKPSSSSYEQYFLSKLTIFILEKTAGQYPSIHLDEEIDPTKRLVDKLCYAFAYPEVHLNFSKEEQRHILQLPISLRAIINYVGIRHKIILTCYGKQPSPKAKL